MAKKTLVLNPTRAYPDGFVEKKMIDLHEEIIKQQMLDEVRRVVYGYDYDIDVEGE